MYSPSSSGDLRLCIAVSNVTDTTLLPCLLLGASRTLDGQCSPESNEDVYTSKKAAPLSTAGKLILAISGTCTLSVMASQTLCSLSSSGSLSRPSHEGGKLTIRFAYLTFRFFASAVSSATHNRIRRFQAAQDLRRFDCTVDVPTTRKII
jgi:hypothetical protein